MKKKLLLGLGVVVVVLGSMLLLKSVKTVPSGNTGVVSVFGQVQDDYLTSGIHLVNPIGTKVIKVNNQVQRTDVDIIGASKDLQTINGSISVNYILGQESSATMYKNVGLEYDTIIIRPAIQETAKAIISKYTAEELVTRRSEVSLEMQDALTNKINTYGIVVKEYNILNFDFSEEFNKAIEAKQTAQQQALKAKQDLERIKVEAEQKVAEAQAEAEAYKLKSQQITQEMIQMEFVDKWDGKLPTVISGDSSTNLMDISSMVNMNK